MQLAESENMNPESGNMNQNCARAPCNETRDQFNFKNGWPDKAPSGIVFQDAVGVLHRLCRRDQVLQQCLRCVLRPELAEKYGWKGFQNDWAAEFILVSFLRIEFFVGPRMQTFGEACMSSRLVLVYTLIRQTLANSWTGF